MIKIKNIVLQGIDLELNDILHHILIPEKPVIYLKKKEQTGNEYYSIKK